VFSERVVRRVGADIWRASSGAPAAAVSQADRRGHLRGSRWPVGRALAGLRNIRTHTTTATVKAAPKATCGIPEQNAD
jgi:hypothetical protein